MHEYGRAVGRGNDPKALIFRPASYLPANGDQQTIIAAFKLFYAHMIYFHTRTQKEYETYETCRKYLNTFIDDASYQEIITYRYCIQNCKSTHYR